MAIKTFKNLKANLAAIPTPLNAFVNPIDVLVKRREVLVVPFKALS